MTLIAIVIGTLVAGVGSVWLAAMLSFRALAGYTQHMLSLAAGALLATAFMHLLPEAFESPLAPAHLFMALLTGLVFFFLLDKAELWHHGHEHHHEHGEEPGHDHDHAVHEHAAPRAGSWAVLAGDSVHCFGDGVLIASAFTASLQLGMVAALAVLTHEVPHHMGDLMVLRQSGGTRRIAAIKVSLAGGATAVGGVVGYGLLSGLHDFLPYFLVVAASSFVYVALADLIPQLQKRLSARGTVAQIGWLLLGIVLVTAASHLAHE
ncbi:MAG: ZIP family metal transporter [Proteobacteria bacterium]|nr:ZIP family metal transporter [Pseudomonadota bacterium]